MQDDTMLNLFIIQYGFDFDGQGHIKVKVKFSLVSKEVLPQVLFYPSLKIINPLITKS